MRLSAADQPLPVPEKRFDRPTPWQIRDEFHRLMREELVGPKDGEDEELWSHVESHASNRYVLGVLAPMNTRAPLEDALQADDVESTETTDETDDEPPRATADSMLSTSIGMTFCVDDQTTALQVHFAWAVYRKQKSEKGFKTPKRGDPASVWKRIPYEKTLTVPVGAPVEIAPHPDFPKVMFRARFFPLDDGCHTMTVFLENGQDGKEAKDEAWLFQVRMEVSAPDGRACFQKQTMRHQADNEDPLTRQMEDHLALLYRKEVEFAIGHGASVDWEAGDDPRRACRVWTEAMPAYEVRKARTPAVAGVELRMGVLGNSTPAQLTDYLAPVVPAYRTWVREQRAKIDDATEMIEGGRDREAAVTALQECERAADRLQAGIDLLASDPHAGRAFAFMNRVMHVQRIRGLYSAARRRDEKAPVRLADVEASETPAWRLFQLAFILITLPSLTQLDHPERCDSADPTSGPMAELLWFATGGGKTEAYLGLTAYILALRRLQGTIAGRNGEQGVAVLMRYTLRLLTLQQFQRATTLICACEVERRKDPKTWGEERFRIGLWVGQGSTPNTVKQAAELLEAERGGKGSAGRGTLKQLTACPWCGAKIELGRDVEVDRDHERVIFYCGDGKGMCDFGRRKAKGEGIPIAVVDEQIYRLLPALVIATVDKFAQMPWNGEVGLLFGRADRFCERHGFLCPDSPHEGEYHVGRNGLPMARIKPTGLLRPPDLIIQDELHLITGPLGSLVDLYETAIDDLCSWTVHGNLVRPKIVLSTATIKRAHIQVQKLFGRRLRVFPPRAINVEETFFAKEDPVTPSTPGLRYIGVCAFGRRLKATLIRVYIAALCAANTLQKLYPDSADQLMTLVGYFASLRELGSMRRLLEDDVRNRCRSMDARGLEPRKGMSIEELTSRKKAADIPYILSRLETPCPPELEQRKAMEPRPIDVLIATNMISVGVDVPRLGLMVVTGQPKATSEYIQATSRVGRNLPGIVITVYNYARPRDVSHYEAFRGYHASYHVQVENPSVTPFSTGSIHRGLSAVLVGLSRLKLAEMNADTGANRAPTHSPFLDANRAAIVARAALCADNAEERENVERGVQKRVDRWIKRVHEVTAVAAALNYKRPDSNRVPLLLSAESGPWKMFTCLNSLRGVEQASHLVLLDDFGGESPPPETDSATEEDA